MFTLRIMGRPVKIQLVAPNSSELDDGSFLGTFRSYKDVIHIDQALPSRQKFVCLIHELTHVVHDTTQIEVVEGKQKYVDVERCCDLTGYLFAELLEQIDVIPEEFLIWLNE